MNNSKNKHLSFDERVTIQEGLDLGLSINHIARSLGRSPSTISREIIHNRSLQGKRRPDLMDPCANHNTCNIFHLCRDIDCNSKCRTCKKCKTVCPNYITENCTLLERSPHVCNHCRKYNSCAFSRYVYRASLANNNYRTNLSEVRCGIDISEDDLYALDQLVSPLLKKGQSIQHIYNTHKKKIPCSISTLYTYIDMGVLSARNIDLPRKIRFKKRKHKYLRLDEETRMSILSRNYQRYLKYMEENPDLPVVEMDTVIGTLTSKKVLLTLLFRSCNLMLIYLLDHKSQECVCSTLNDLCDALGIDTYKKLFPVILTDRGTEFLYPEALECDRNGEIKSKVFYCDAQASYQKPKIERNHEFIRYILPKGYSFDELTQADIDLVRDHINSHSRKQYNGASPYQLSRILLDNRLHEVLGLAEIPADDIHLKPDLLGQKNITKCYF